MEAEIEFTNFSAWEDFDRIAKILKKELKFQLIQKIEGPDARVYKFSESDLNFYLVCDDMAGNFLKSEKAENKDMLEYIVRKTEQILKNK